VKTGGFADVANITALWPLSEVRMKYLFVMPYYQTLATKFPLLKCAPNKPWFARKIGPMNLPFA